MGEAKWVDSVDELLDGVGSGMRISVGGVHFIRAPIASIRALATRDINNLTYVAWGGGIPLEMMLEAGLVTRAEICFSSLDVFGLAPHFRRAAESGALEVVDLTALGLMTGLRAWAENLAWEVMQEPTGSDVMSEHFMPVRGDDDQVPMVRIAPIEVDVMLLHAQRADAAGNVEIQGARATDLATVFAAKRVLVTVEEMVPVGQLGAPRAFILPRSHVSRIAVVPYGAYPTSCLPYYPHDLKAVASALEESEQNQSPRAFQFEPPTPEKRALLSVTTGVPFHRSVDAIRACYSDKDSGGWSIAELMAILISRSVTNESICSFGSAAPLAGAAYLLARHTHAPDALLMSHNGGYVDIAARPLTLSLAEVHDFQSAAAHTGGDETYHWFYQAGMVTHEVVGSAQVDASGATNNVRIVRGNGSVIRLPGQGGMADVANLHRDLVIYLPRQDPRNTPSTLDYVSAARVWEEDERLRYGFQAGRMAVITNLGVMERNPKSRRLEIISLHQGVTVEDFQAATGFEIAPSDRLTETLAPTDDELLALRSQIDPLGLCRLEFASARDRRALLMEALQAEAAAISTCVTVQ